VFGANICSRLAACLLAGLMGITTVAPAAFAQGDRQPRNKVVPVYPELAKRMNVRGAVKIEVTITPAGTVRSTKVVGGHPLLVDPAVDAVKKWRFEPASEETTQVVVFNFSPNAQ